MIKQYTQHPKITCPKEIKDRLDTFGNKGDRYEDILVKLMNKFEEKNE